MEPTVEQIPGGFRVTTELQLPAGDEPEPPAPDVVGAVLGGAAKVVGGVLGAVVKVLRPEGEREQEEAD